MITRNLDRINNPGPTHSDAGLVFQTLTDFHHLCTPAELKELETMYKLTHDSVTMKVDHHTGLDLHTERYSALVTPLRQRLQDLRNILTLRKRKAAK